LSVLSVHLSRAVPRLKGFSQSQRGGVVGGFHLASFRAGGDGPATSPVRAAQLLRAYLRRQYREASAVFSLPPKVADRLAADFLLAALLRAQRSLGLCNSAVQSLAAQWLNAAGLRGCGSLIDVDLPDGRAALALGRKICCQHHRRPDGGLCSSCPRLPPERRLALLREELAAAC
jgi:siderophore ferric iron reductase